MKKIFILAMAMLFIFPVICSAATISNEITNRTYNPKNEYSNMPSKDDGRWKLPLIGASAGETFYLDTKSCTYWIKGNVATVSCIVYTGGRGAAPDGGPAMVSPTNFQFDTYKTKKGRKIFLKSVDGESKGKYFEYWLESDNGFLLNLFWETSKHSGLKKYLD